MPQSATRSNRHAKQPQDEPPGMDNDDYDERDGTSPIFFWREWEEPHGFLCQFYRCSFTSQIDESPIPVLEDNSSEQHTFKCAEQYMMYHKALILTTPGQSERHGSSNKSQPIIPAERKHLPEAILASDNPTQQKYLVRSMPFTTAQNQLYERIKLDIVEQGTYYKFTQNLDFKRKLLATGDRKLVDAAPNDRVWGIGFLARDARKHTHTDQWGANLLGIALMNVRDRIRNEDEEAQESSTTEHVEEGR